MHIMNIKRFHQPDLLILGLIVIIGASAGRRRGLLTLNLALWGVGLGVIVMQRLSWWEYHYLLLIVPLGVLAAQGLDALWTRCWPEPRAGNWSWRLRVVALLSLALLFSPFLLALALKSWSLARHGFAFRKEPRLAYQSVVSQDYQMSDYQTALAEVAFLSAPSSLPGKIFVGGNPVYYYLSGREPAVAANGWMLELFLPEQWEQLTGQLAQARPPYIFIAAEYPVLISERSPATARFLEEQYRVLRQSRAGVWYVIR